MRRQALARHLPGRRRLAIAGHRVIFRIGRDARASTIGPGGAEGGRHAAGAGFDLEPLVLQACDIPGRRLVFAQRRFAVMPDDLVPVGQIAHAAIHPAEHSFLVAIHALISRRNQHGDLSAVPQGPDPLGLTGGIDAEEDRGRATAGVIVLSHLSFGVADLANAAAFYDGALGALGYVRVWSNEDGVGYGAT